MKRRRFGIFRSHVTSSVLESPTVELINDQLEQAGPTRAPDPVRRAATLARWQRGIYAGRMAARYGKHSPEAIDADAALGGRESQPDGRHSAEYVATNAHVGMYPMGGARRVTVDNDQGGDVDRGDNDPHMRWSIDAEGKVTR